MYLSDQNYFYAVSKLRHRCEGHESVTINSLSFMWNDACIVLYIFLPDHVNFKIEVQNFPCKNKTKCIFAKWFGTLKIKGFGEQIWATIVQNFELLAQGNYNLLWF